MYHATLPYDTIRDKCYSPRLIRDIYGKKDSKRAWMEVHKISYTFLKKVEFKMAAGFDIENVWLSTYHADKSHNFAWDENGNYDRVKAFQNKLA